MRGRRVAVGSAVVVAALLAAGTTVAVTRGSDGNRHPAAGAGDEASASTPAPGTTSSTSTGSATSSTTSTTLAANRDVTVRHAVGTAVEVYVDRTRLTSPNGDFPGAPERTLVTEIWYPAQGDPGPDPGASSLPGAAPDRSRGPYPVVVFAHGFGVTPDFYAALLSRWAAAGFVVVAPTYPILSGTPGGASHVDYVQTFFDTSFVITQVEAATRRPGNLLAGLADPGRLAVAGHSDGEVIAWAVGFLECCRDPRVDAVLAMAGDLANANNPFVGHADLPVLHVMDTEDAYDPYPHSIAWDRENLPSPRWILTLLGASHAPPFANPRDPWFPVVLDATVAFLDGTLVQPDQLDAIGGIVASARGRAALER